MGLGPQGPSCWRCCWEDAAQSPRQRVPLTSAPLPVTISVHTAGAQRHQTLHPPEPQDPGSQPRKSGLCRDPHLHAFPCSDIKHPKVTSPASPRAECGSSGLDKRRPPEERPPAGATHLHPQPASRGSPHRFPLEPRSSARKAGGRTLAALPLSHPQALRCRQGLLHHERGSLPPRHKEPSRVNRGSGDEFRGHHIPSRLT